MPGYEVRSKTNNEYIFLPAAGIRDYDEPIKDLCSNGYYWSSSLRSTWDGYDPNGVPGYAFSYDFNSSGTVPYGGSRYMGRSIRSVYEESNPPAPEPEAVDLGLPSGLKWASFNVGANNPYEYGNYYAWGETEPKPNYNWPTYKWCNGDYNKLTKYCTQSSFWNSSDPMDNKTVLDPEDDAASANWGGNWRMPTEEEWNELWANCTCTWTSDYNGTGIAGRIVTSSISGYEDKSIFLPAAGDGQYGTTLCDAGSYGHYWSSSLYKYPDGAWRVRFPSDAVYGGDYARCYGRSVRPVCPKD
jgi:uncharacterized protein (TIGR02145 family)